MKAKQVWYLIKDSAAEWSDDNASRLSAALAYYTLFSIAPLLVLILGIVSLVLGEEEGRSQAIQQLGGTVGQGGSSMLQDMVRSAQKPTSGIIASAISFIVLLFTASNLFYALQTSLNTVWDVQQKSLGVWGSIKNRLPTLWIIPVVGLLLLASLVASAGISALGQFTGNIFPGVQYLLHAADFLLSFVVVGLLFALMYKILPDADIKWSDVWLGAGVTSLLFSIGKLLIGLYLGKSSMSSMYGAAGSLVVLLAWVYYSAQIFFLGAEFTQVYSNQFGSRVKPSSEAEPLPGEKPEAEQRPSRPGDQEKPTERPSDRAGHEAERRPDRTGVGPQSIGGTALEPGEAYPLRIPAIEKVEEERAERPSFVALSSFLGGLIIGFFLWRPHKPA